MFEFKKYPSIDNSYRSKTINQIIRQGFDKEEWIVLLKVHGANFSVWTDGKVIQPAKRTSFISEDENFNSWDKVILPLKDNFIKIFEYMKIHGMVKDQAVFCGELAGGNYNHPDTKKYPQASKIQKGVDYAPFNFFFMFDIVCDDKFISHDDVINLGDYFGIIAAQGLLRGTFEECMQHSNEFPDPLHRLFGLPEVDDNVCEGIIIKPVVPRFFGNGSRVILKNKNDKFKENNGEKKNKVPREKHKWGVSGAKLYSLLSTYISENRLRNVLSHGLVITQKDFGKLMKEMNIDVWDDFYKDHSDEYDILELNEQKMIKKSMGPQVADLIRKDFQNIVDGEY